MTTFTGDLWSDPMCEDGPAMAITERPEARPT